jgi:hypothetical protein
MLLSVTNSWVPEHIYTNQPCAVWSLHANCPFLLYNCNWMLHSEHWGITLVSTDNLSWPHNRHTNPHIQSLSAGICFKSEVLKVMDQWRNVTFSKVLAKCRGVVNNFAIECIGRPATWHCIVSLLNAPARTAGPR